MVLYLNHFFALTKAQVSAHTLENLKGKEIIFRTDTAERNLTMRDEIRTQQSANVSKFVQRKCGNVFINKRKINRNKSDVFTDGDTL